MSIRSRVVLRPADVLACLTLLGGVLIAWGSQWRFTSIASVSQSHLVGVKGPTTMAIGPGSPAHLFQLSSWVLLVLLIGAILLMSLAAEVATARLRRESIGWGLLLIATMLGAYLVVVATSTSGTTSSLGLGFRLAGAGCACALLGSSLWTLDVRRHLPRERLS
jgi:hypothetical protein